MKPTALRIIAAIPGIPMALFAIGLFFQPEQAVANLSMPLLEGAALSTQLGDMTSFFVCTGAFIFMGAYLSAPRWLYAGAALLIVTAFARTLAYLIHGADFSAEPIAVEVVSTIWLVTCAILMRKSSEAETA